MSLKAKILITDTNCLVGFQLIKDLYSQGEKMRVLNSKNNDYSHLNDYKDAIEFVDANLLDIILLEDALQGIEQIYHCKELLSFHPQDEQILNTTNIIETRNLVNVSLNSSVKKIVYLSSTMAYGTYTFKGSINENTKWIDDKDNNNYGFSKHLAELEIQRGQEEGLETIIVNPALIIGENSQKNALYNLQNIANGQYRFYPNGTNGFVNLVDVSKACIQLMQSTISDEKFIISAKNLTYQTILEKLNPALVKKKLFPKSNSTKVNMVCRWNSMKSFIFDARPFLSQEIHNFHGKNFELDGSKICNSIDFKYSEI
jgi:dihydroflavonol-4-reductase